MSIGIATMGKFRYQFHQNWQVSDGGSDGWWMRSKPVVVIRSIIEDDKYDKNKPAIEIIVEREGDL
jgi:hypothetical protein